MVLMALSSGCFIGMIARPQAASDEVIKKATYHSKNPPSVSLVTVNSHDIFSRLGTHTALIVNASQQVIYDPAGTYKNTRAPSKYDLFYGASPDVIKSFIAYHIDNVSSVVVQTKEVPMAVAEALLKDIERQGPSRHSQCSKTVSNLLHKTPGFESINPSLLPFRTMRAFATLNGIKTLEYHDKNNV